MKVFAPALGYEASAIGPPYVTGSLMMRTSSQTVVAVAALILAIGMLHLTLVIPHRSLISGDALTFFEYTD